MLIKRHIEVDGVMYPVTLSDESRALQAAYAAGGAIIGIWEPGSPDNPGLSLCLYLVTDPREADDALLEKAVRRHMGFPWTAAKTRRLIIREFCGDDPLEPAEEAFEGETGNRETGCPSDIFRDQEKRLAYIGSQYRFYECGLWCLEARGSGAIVGKAGITAGELGYHIYRPFRGQGYAYEACLAILSYAQTELKLSKVFLRTGRENLPSIGLAGKLGFVRGAKKETEGEVVPEGLVYYEKVL